MAGPYVGVDPESPLGQLIIQVEALQSTVDGHIHDPAAHPEMQALISVSAIAAQVAALQAALDSTISAFTLHLNPATDGHSQYYNEARGDARYALKSVLLSTYAELVADFNSHKNSAVNPHPQYVLARALADFFSTAGFKSLAYQASDNVNITGGVIAGVEGWRNVYRYTGASAATHVITHNLNQRYVTVQVIDSGTNEAVPAASITSITFDTVNQLTVVLGSATAIKAVITG